MTMFLMSLLPERNQGFVQVQIKHERPENEFSSMIVNLAVPITLESSASSSSGYTWIKVSIMDIICSNWRVCFKIVIDQLMSKVQSYLHPRVTVFAINSKLFSLACVVLKFTLKSMIRSCFHLITAIGPTSANQSISGSTVGCWLQKKE